MDVTLTLTFEGKDAVRTVLDLLDTLEESEEEPETEEWPGFSAPEYPEEREAPAFTGETAGEEYVVTDATFNRSRHFFPVLYAVHRMGAGTFRETVEWLTCHSSRDHKEGSVSGALTYLKENGYLHTRESRSDGRAFVYTLTEKGETAIRDNKHLLSETGLYGVDPSTWDATEVSP